MNSRLIVVLGYYLIGLLIAFSSKAGLLEVSRDTGALISIIIICTGSLFSAITQPKEDNTWLKSREVKKVIR